MAWKEHEFTLTDTYQEITLWCKNCRNFISFEYSNHEINTTEKLIKIGQKDATYQDWAVLGNKLFCPKCIPLIGSSKPKEPKIMKSLKQNNKYEIYKTLVVSSAHITEEESKMLDDCKYILKDEFKYLIFIGEIGEPFHEIQYYIDKWFNGSQNIRDLMILALQQDCIYLCIDGDGPILDNFETYNW